ncbi:response regulator transcription factor [Flavobacterium agricola]|uniref:Response regulator transcription factor n=1 Tax=Flavobacterium agricola TaxID=2870839 RepID=A0ABY6LWJ0_9FLAO|nr:response regulator transcription factor [Flavobacterium agricola]UYW00708.1 response regulator transcription factor [Flavobacterium agricola]
MEPIKCILIDDELPSLTYLKAIVEQIDTVEVVKVYNQSEKFLAEYKNLDFDLVVSDIQMPVLDGLALANIMQNKQFIFTTAFRDFAVEAFELNAVDYLTKPIQKERLEKAIAKAQMTTAIKPEPVSFCTLNTDRGKMVLQFSDILYIKVSDADPRDKIALLPELVEVVLKNITFKELNKILPAELFCQINKKEIIAYSAVNFFTADAITTKIRKNNGFLELVLSPNFAAKFRLK